MSLAEVYENPRVCKLEEKFAVDKVGENKYKGRYPLEPFRQDARGTYGGEFVAQSVRAAYETVDADFEIHSLHLYFLKAGLMELVMVYDVEPMSDGRSFCSRLVRCYQEHTQMLCFTMTVSFTRNNNVKQRKVAFAQLSEEQRKHPRTKVPFEFLKPPHYTFDKYVNKLDLMPKIDHTNGNLLHILIPETWRKPRKLAEPEPGARVFGLFFKVNDNADLAKQPQRTKMVDFAFALDSFYLGTVMRAVFPVLDFRKSDFFRVSLDHSIFFHDTDFDPTEWMYLQYTFLRLANDRVLVMAQFYTTDKRLVATVLQEALCMFPLKLIEGNRHGSYKL